MKNIYKRQKKYPSWWVRRDFLSFKIHQHWKSSCGFQKPNILHEKKSRGTQGSNRTLGIWFYIHKNEERVGSSVRYMLPPLFSHTCLIDVIFDEKPLPSLPFMCQQCEELLNNLERHFYNTCKHQNRYLIQRPNYIDHYQSNENPNKRKYQLLKRRTSKREHKIGGTGEDFTRDFS